MQVSEIRVKLVENRSDRLKAFCSVTFDNDFVVRDLKIIEGAGGYFVAMPSRKLTDHCESCGAKNHLRARFCNDCGARLKEDRARRNNTGRTKLHADIAHPVNSKCREYIQAEIVKAFEKELELSKQPGYRPKDMDDYEEDYSEAPQSAPATSSGIGDDQQAQSPTESQEAESEPKEQPGFSDGIM
jgi:stage V sporulation protein G